jgi:pimeloyl-ACP methyl ester carboxylesterase
MLAAVADEQQHTTELGGRKLAWRSLGDGPPLLLVNGYAASSADWDPTLFAKLSDSFELVCPDNRGMGSELLATFWPGARSERIAGGGHAFMAQQPERVAELIVDFLRG